MAKTVETCVRIKGDYEELIAKLYEDPATQVKISKAMCELDERRQATKTEAVEDTSGSNSDVKAETGGRVRSQLHKKKLKKQPGAHKQRKRVNREGAKDADFSNHHAAKRRIRSAARY